MQGASAPGGAGRPLRNPGAGAELEEELLAPRADAEKNDPPAQPSERPAARAEPPDGVEVPSRWSLQLGAGDLRIAAVPGRGLVFHASERARRLLTGALVAGGALFVLVFVALAAADNVHRLSAVLGLAVFASIAYLCSDNKKAISWQPVLWGFFLQFFLGVIILRTRPGYVVFEFLGRVFSNFLDNSDAGSLFLFGPKFANHFFAMKVLPTLVFFSAFISVLYYAGVLQWVVQILAALMQRVLGTSGAESLFLIFVHLVGSSEASLFIKPYISALTHSEMHMVMTGGFATISGSLLVVYIQMGVPSSHLLAASVMSTPASLALSKLMAPETGEPSTRGTVRLQHVEHGSNPVDAARLGAAEGLSIALHILAMLVAFLGILAAVDAGLSALGQLFGLAAGALTLEAALGLLLRPAAWLMGVPWGDCAAVGTLLGRRTLLNEFIAYLDLKAMMAAGRIGERGAAIATYALCGFANLGSIGVTVGCLGSISPGRKADAARLGLRTMLAGSLALCMTAAVAGILV
eukprot:tig00000204_g17687.t1